MPEQYEVEQLASRPAVAVHERVDVLEHRVKSGRLEQRVRVASVQSVDQGSQVVADLQRVRGLDPGRGDPGQVAVGTERAAGERLEIQRGHLVYTADQLLVQLPAILGVFAHVGHAIRDAARGEHVSGR